MKTTSSNYHHSPQQNSKEGSHHKELSPKILRNSLSNEHRFNLMLLKTHKQTHKSSSFIAKYNLVLTLKYIKESLKTFRDSIRTRVRYIKSVYQNISQPFVPLNTAQSTKMQNISWLISSLLRIGRWYQSTYTKWNIDYKLGKYQKLSLISNDSTSASRMSGYVPGVLETKAGTTPTLSA